MPEEHDSRLRRYLLVGWAGRQFDSVPELGMHVGTWLMIFAIGMVWGRAIPHTFELVVAIFAVGAVIGVAGQLAVEVDFRD